VKSSADKPKKATTEMKVVADDQEWQPHPGRVKIRGSKTSTDILMEMRAEENY
jgi:hypothetical protein